MIRGRGVNSRSGRVRGAKEGMKSIEEVHKCRGEDMI